MALYTADEYFEANAELSNYSDEVLKGVQAKWKISKEGTIGPLADEKSVISSGTFTATTAHSGSLTSLDSIRTSLSGVKKAAKLNVLITIPGTNYQNEWPIWVYPNITDSGTENPEQYYSRAVRLKR